VLGPVEYMMFALAAKGRLPYSSAGLAGWFGRRGRGLPNNLGGGVQFRGRQTRGSLGRVSVSLVRRGHEGCTNELHRRSRREAH
jgi:hypothetical protein